MSISVENLSLLGALAPLRQISDNNVNAIRQDGRFAGSLDRALGNGESTALSASGKAKELAESLTLQMLQSSLDITGDTAQESAAILGSARVSSAHLFMQAYRDNLVAGEEKSPSLPPQNSPSQLQELSNSVVAPASAALQATQPRSGDSWLDPIISKASIKYGVDVGLIKAVIKAESGFNPQAVSSAGARGLMQLMPATARSLGVNDSFDPEQNVMGGTRFLKDMLRRYDGNVDAALAAYNWGPGNVDKRPDNLPRETRNYLVRVKQLYASYSS